MSTLTQDLQYGERRRGGSRAFALAAAETLTLGHPRERGDMVQRRSARRSARNSTPIARTTRMRPARYNP
jgi:hypothetical protein